jgi:hypothetical protein
MTEPGISAADPVQESRSAGLRAPRSMIVMDITIRQTLLPHDDPDASLAFDPGTSIVLYPPPATPGMTFRDPAGNLVRIQELR